MQRLNQRLESSTSELQKCVFEGLTSSHSTYMRLLGGILRPSRYQVTWGWGKLRILGAGMTAPSPWETDCERSPSSKLPMTVRKQRKKQHQKVWSKGQGQFLCQRKSRFPLLKAALSHLCLDNIIVMIIWTMTAPFSLAQLLVITIKGFPLCSTEYGQQQFKKNLF